VKYLESYCQNPPCNHDPSEAAFCRFLISACVCLPILWANRHQYQLILAGMECGFWVTVNYITQAEALEYIPASRCSFISSLSVVTIPFMAALFMGKPLRAMSVVSAMIALVGVAILENIISIGGGGQAAAAAAAVEATMPAGSTIFGVSKGDLLALGQPLCFGYFVMRIEHYMEKFKHIPSRVLTITATQCVTVCVSMFFWVLWDCGGTLPDMTYMFEPHRLIALGWTGIISSVGAIILQAIALQKASATDAALIFSSEPIWGCLFAGWLLNEKMSKTAYIGGSFILVACVLGSVTSAGSESSSSSVSSEREKQRRNYHKKSSNGDSDIDDFMLPTTRATVNPQMAEKDMSPDSVASLTDVRHFPPNVAPHSCNGDHHA
jgi:drug/metabolite transporter (DMT)-like permease